MNQTSSNARTEKPTIYPTLVIGVGGMGTNTVRAAKRRFRMAWGGDKLPGMIQLMALDTEPLVNRLDQEPLFADEFAYMGKFDATRLVDNIDNHPEIGRWWNYPSIPLGYIHNGAKQLRPIGRLSFFRNYVTFKRQLENKYANLDKIRDMEMAQNRGFPVMGNYQLVYIVSSLCGGTGAGMFLDVAHRVRAMVRSNARIVGIFYLPEVLEEEIASDLQRRRIQANAYAALKELNYFQETQTFQELYPSEQRLLPDTPYTPFDFIFLLNRTNRDGRSLSRKSDAEHLAAHLIQLTAMSHLSSDILGLEVNVVRERMRDSAPAAMVTDKRISELEAAKNRHFLVYSSFATSALVAPHESLVNFWRRAFVADLIRRFAAGPALDDPRTALSPQDRQRVLSIWQTLLGQLLLRFASLDNEQLDAILEEVGEQRGAWHSFREPVHAAMRQAMVETGLRGALALCDLIGPQNPAGAPIESLPRQRLFQLDGHPVSEDERQTWRRLLAQDDSTAERISQLAGGFGDLILTAFSPRQARDRQKDMARRKAFARVYQRRDTVERTIVDQLGQWAGSLREALRGQVAACGIALSRANAEASRMADRIDPRIPDGTPGTSTYYELETGAIGRDYLQHFYRRAASAVGSGDWTALLSGLMDRLLSGPTTVAADQVFSVLDAAVAGDMGLLSRIHNMVDIRHVITVQHDQEVEAARQRPDNRIHQWLDRLNPYIRWDSDRFSFQDADLEHIRLAATPVAREDDPKLAAAMIGQENLKWIPTGDPSRMDAVWIVHGLPVTLLERLEQYKAQYENRQDFPIPQEFHLNPAWAALPDIAPEDNMDLDPLAEDLFARRRHG